MTDRTASAAPGSRFSGLRRSRWSLSRWTAGVITAGILAAMLPLLATTLDDIDPFNFALGVRDFDPRRHQPHPPGYPVYIALGKVSTAVVGALWPEPPGAPVAGQRVAARGLAFWSALAGSLSLLPLVALFRRLVLPVGENPAGIVAGDLPRRGPAVDARSARFIAAGAAAITVSSPLFWFTSLRPLSDVPGLVAAVAAQVLILRARAASFENVGDNASAFRAWAIAGLVAAMAVGLRSQTLWLTVPLGAVALVGLLRVGARSALTGAIVGLVAGGTAWAVPLVMASGGLPAYVAAIGSQGAEDFAGVDMLFRQPTARRLAFGLVHTFVWPWATIPLAVAVIGLAAVGTLYLAWRRPSAIGWIAAAFGPYTAFHLVFHETVTTRYALPIVVPMACLASAGAWAIARRFHPAVAGAIVAVALYAAVPAAWAYATAGSPISRVVTAMVERAGEYSPRPVLAMHERPDRDSRRALQWMIGDRPFWSARLPRVAGEEVRQIVAAWAGGERRPVWFLASPRRTDLAVVDPVARRVVVDADWPFASETFAGNTRPGRVIWYELTDPGWFLGRGWALTPELAGADARDGRGPSIGPVDAWVRRRTGAAVLMIGGRDLGRSGTVPGSLVITVDGRPLTTVATRSTSTFFLWFLDLPPGALAGEGDYARLEAVVTAEDGSNRPTSVVIEQFDLQNAGRTLAGYDAGWHEPEYNPETGRSWRWASDRSAIHVHTGSRDVVVRVSGESPRRYYRRAPVVSLTAGGREFLRVEPARDFTVEATIPRSAIAASDGLIWLTTDQSFVPAERDRGSDRRRLGLRIYDVTVTGQDDTPRAGARRPAGVTSRPPGHAEQ